MGCVLQSEYKLHDGKQVQEMQVVSPEAMDLTERALLPTIFPRLSGEGGSFRTRSHIYRTFLVVKQTPQESELPPED
jgi:hypothetical protein